MNPILLRLPLGGASIAVGSYSTFYLLAWLLAPALGVWLAARRGMPWRRVAVAYYVALAAGVAGARLLDLFVAARFYEQDPSRILSLNFQGFSLYGGLGVACVVAIVLAQALRLPVWRLADASIPAIASGIVLMRTGCFLKGCCFGEQTDLPWGVTYPVGSPAWEYQALHGSGGLLGALSGQVSPVHPTQLYEMLAAVVLCALALLLGRLGVPDGVPFLGFAADFTIARLLIGFVRVRQEVITAPEWFYTAFYSAVIAVLVGLMVMRFLQEAAERRRALASYP